MSNWTNEAVLDALRGVVEPELGKDLVSLELVEVEGSAGEHGAGLTLTVKSSNPAMHARKRMHAQTQVRRRACVRARTRTPPENV